MTARLAAIGNRIGLLGHFAISGKRGPSTIPIRVALTKTELSMR